MPKYWMISDRKFSGRNPSGALGDLTFWTSDGGDLQTIESWSSCSRSVFQKQLVGAADDFETGPTLDPQDQKHVCFFIHGYNNGFKDAAERYNLICDGLFSGPTGLGICVSFDWPSLGSLLGYLPDRDHAQECSSDAAQLFQALHEWLGKKQALTAKDPAKACKAQLSIIAHSMGNYLTQKALASVWKRINQPLSVSLIDQFLMVAADVDNDVFDQGAEDATDGEAVANLCYRVTALYSGRDAVLGTSAGLKHFGTRRLGRSGLATLEPRAADGRKRDNVWDIDCSTLLPDGLGGVEIHGAYFKEASTIALMRSLLRGVDRTVLERQGGLTNSARPAGTLLR